MYTKENIGLSGGSASPRPVSAHDRLFARSNMGVKTRRVNTMNPSPLSMPHGRPCRAPWGRTATGYGYPVLSSPATVPSQMPLRRVVSQSETISAPGQCRTLRRGLEAVYGPYSTSAPSTRQSTNGRTRSPEPREPDDGLTGLSSGPPGVAILTVITRPKSQWRCAITRAKEIGCYRQRGRGRGCDPAST